MKFHIAYDIALALVERMKPHCERVEIAGSLRRGVSEVKDIELVAIPKWEERPHVVGLFGEKEIERVNLLHEWACIAECDQLVTWIKPSTSEIVPWPIKQDGKSWRGLLPQDIKLDLFLCEPRNWGAIYMLRTGSREFMRAIAARAKRMNRPLDGGFYHRNGIEVETYQEQDVFRLLGICFVEPHLRVDETAIRPLNGQPQTVGPSHACAAPGCSAPVPHHMLMCSTHWFKVPKPLRDEVWQLYRASQSGDDVAKADHRRACAAAVRALREVPT